MPKITRKQSQAIMEYAAETEDEGLYSAALELGAKGDAHFCAARGWLKAIRLLVASGANLNRVIDNWRPFECAVDAGHWDAALFLWKNGARTGRGWVWNSDEEEKACTGKVAKK